MKYYLNGVVYFKEIMIAKLMNRHESINVTYYVDYLPLVDADTINIDFIQKNITLIRLLTT